VGIGLTLASDGKDALMSHRKSTRQSIVLQLLSSACLFWTVQEYYSALCFQLWCTHCPSPIHIHLFTSIYPLRGASQGCGDSHNKIHNIPVELQMS